MFPIRKATSVLGVLTMVTVLGACSSSSKSGTSSPTTSSSGAAATATGAPIKVGVECTCSGPLATSIPSASSVYTAWDKSVNASGGIDGHPVQLVEKDDTGNPGTAVSNIQSLLSDGVIAINDLSLVDEPWAATVQKANIPVVGSNAIEAPFYTNPDFYPTGQTNDSTTYSLAAAAKEAGATSLGDLYCAEAAVCQALVGLTKRRRRRSASPSRTGPRPRRPHPTTRLSASPPSRQASRLLFSTYGSHVGKVCGGL